jgi:hypothetical protein
METALVGAVGEATAEAMGAFIRFGRDIASFESVVAAPDKAALSDNPTAQLLQVYQFITRVEKREEAEAVVKYVLRMRTEMQSLFCNTLANSQRLSLFVTLTEFAKMLAAHRDLFNTK